MFCTLLAMLNHANNPLIYGLMNKKMRKPVVSLFSCVLRCRNNNNNNSNNNNNNNGLVDNNSFVGSNEEEDSQPTTATLMPPDERLYSELLKNCSKKDTPFTLRMLENK